jgi:maltooligosyltrehalose trehalohydrolase
VKPVTVWSPVAKTVELIKAGTAYPMIRETDGHFTALGIDLEPETDYSFSVDGGDPLPDPRSPFQPYGVHGTSRWVTTEFEWADNEFSPTPLHAAIIYELHVGTFSADGTFDGVIERLDYLRNLGITHVELMPIAQFSGDRGWGYDGVQLYAPHAPYGGPLGLKRLINACHVRGLSILLDVVYNHFGPDGNYLPRFGPYLTENAGTPWGAAVNFDRSYSREVRAFLVENALMWLEDYHCDGLRLDAVHAIQDTSPRHFLEELSDAVHKLSVRLDKPLSLIAESDLNDPRLLLPKEIGGFGIDAAWNDDFHHALHVVLTGERDGMYGDFHGIRDLACAVERGFVYEGQFSQFRNRPHGRPFGNLSLRRLVGYSQNHDQVGNRALGERMSMLISARRALLGAMLVLLGPHIPLIFQGEEWASRKPFLYFANHENQELAQLVSEGRRNEFIAQGYSPQEVPDPSAYESFDKSRLDFKEAAHGQQAATLEFYRTLIQLRKRWSGWVSPSVCVSCDEVAGVLVLQRDSSILVINFGSQVVEHSIREDWKELRLAIGTEGASLMGHRMTLESESGALCVNSADDKD